MAGIVSSEGSLFVNRAQVEAELSAQASRIKQLEDGLASLSWQHALLELHYKEALAKNDKLTRKIGRLLRK